jgi:hippurate hydrolase
VIEAALRARLVAVRRDLHQHRELSFREERTAALLARELVSLSPLSAEQVADTTGLAVASRNPRVMHACGHDVHATWALGAAALLAHDPAAGDVLIVQPTEEIGEGARAVMESGRLDEVEVIFGTHVDRRFTVGEVVAQAGPIAASADTFRIELVGRGAHGARPHESADPVLAESARRAWAALARGDA